MGLLAWLVFTLLPDEEKAIRSLLVRLVQAAAIKPKDSGFARLAYADRLAAYFTTNVDIQVEGFGADFSSINGRAELVQAALAARAQLRQAEFSLADVHIKFPPEERKANAYVVITGQINYETNQFGQALRMVLVKDNGQWLISHVHTVQNAEYPP